LQLLEIILNVDKNIFECAHNIILTKWKSLTSLNAKPYGRKKNLIFGKTKMSLDI